MYAIVKSGGRQYRIEENSIIEVDRLGVDEGAEIQLDVLMLSSDSGLKVGTPTLGDVKVVGKVLSHFKGEKINGFTYKPKKSTARRYGHRSHLSRVRIEKIDAGK